MAPAKPESAVAADVALSPNFGARANGRAADCLILHYTGMKSAEAALAWLRDPRSQVSCHYFVWEDGRVTQVALEAARAWHAGVSFWRGERDLNSASIGIELANGGHEFGSPPFPERQIASAIALCSDLIRRLRIPAQRVLAHSDVAPRRKRDPGERFPWRALAEAGVGLWVEPEPLRRGPSLRLGDAGPEVSELQSLLARYGYEVLETGRFESADEAVVRAFQRHFRPERVDGAADWSTRATLRRLLAAAENAA